MKQRLDVVLAARGMVASRSQAESYVRLGQVKVNGRVATKSGQMVADTDELTVTAGEQYVGRAALKLASVAEAFRLNFRDKTVLDVGSSTGGFTEYALRHGARKVIAVEVGTNQLHPRLRGNPQIELHEQTDIRNFTTEEKIDMVVADVSFISLRELLPHISELITPASELVMMVKPQFEVYAEHGHPSTGSTSSRQASSGFHTKVLNKGVIKNDKMRRDILKDFEAWAQQRFRIIDKADSQVAGSKGNLERFYLLRKTN